MGKREWKSSSRQYTMKQEPFRFLSCKTSLNKKVLNRINWNKQTKTPKFMIKIRCNLKRKTLIMKNRTNITKVDSKN